MKKLLVLITIIALALGASGATCMNSVQKVACNPPAAVITALPVAIQLITIALSTFVPGSAAYLAAVDASAAARSIEAGICISATQLSALIAFLQSNDVKSLQAKSNLKAGPAKAQVVNISAFQDWANSLK